MKDLEPLNTNKCINYIKSLDVEKANKSIPILLKILEKYEYNDDFLRLIFGYYGNKNMIVSKWLIDNDMSLFNKYFDRLIEFIKVKKTFDRGLIPNGLDIYTLKYINEKRELSDGKLYTHRIIDMIIEIIKEDPGNCNIPYWYHTLSGLIILLEPKDMIGILSKIPMDDSKEHYRAMIEKCLESSSYDEYIGKLKCLYEYSESRGIIPNYYTKESMLINIAQGKNIDLLEYLLGKVDLEEFFSSVLEHLLDSCNYDGVRILLNHPDLKADYLHQDTPGSISHEILCQRYENEYGYNSEDEDYPTRSFCSIGTLALKYLVEPDTIDLAYKILTLGEFYEELSQKYFASRLSFLKDYIKDNNLPELNI